MRAWRSWIWAHIEDTHYWLWDHIPGFPALGNHWIHAHFMAALERDFPGGVRDG